MAELPPEIITDILLRLPAKSLVRFKCVCKSWNSLMKTPNFIKRQLNQTLISSSHTHLLRWSEFCSSIHSAELDFHHNNLYFSELRHPLETRKVYFFGSCNGVVCISDTSKNDVVLYNPLTKSHLKLPVPANGIPKLHNTVMLFGFGYDSKNDDYKVLRIVQGINYDLSFYNDAKVFSLNNYQWKSVQGIPYYLLYTDCYGGVIVNEALHYMVCNKVSETNLCRFIASFDLQTESFSLMDFPFYDYDDTLRNNVEFYLRELGGCLSVMVNYHTNEFVNMLPPGDKMGNNILYRADLWVMKEYGNKESWVKLFSMSIFKLRIIDSYLCLRPVFTSEDGRRLLIEIDYSEVGWYDLVTKEFTKLTSHGLPNQFFDSGLFVGSLVSLEDRLHPKRGSLPMKNRNRNDLDHYLSAGFKLKL